MSFMWESQVAVYDLFKSYSPLMDKIDAIYDTDIPEGIKRPNRYLILGEIPVELRSASFGRGGKDSLLWIHIWHNGWKEDGSVELGKRLPLAIAEDIEGLLDEKQISLDEWSMLLGETNLLRLSRDQDIPYMHGIIQYRVLGKAPVAL